MRLSRRQILRSRESGAACEIVIAERGLGLSHLSTRDRPQEESPRVIRFEFEGAAKALDRGRRIPRQKLCVAEFRIGSPQVGRGTKLLDERRHGGTLRGLPDLDRTRVL